MATPEQQPVIDLARRTLASRQCSELLRRVIVSQSRLSSTLEISTASDALKENLNQRPSGRAALQSLLQQIASGETADPAIDFAEMADTLAQQTSVTGESVTAASVVILSHAIAEDIFTAACESAIELDPASWFSELNMERKFPQFAEGQRTGRCFRARTRQASSTIARQIPSEPCGTVLPPRENSPSLDVWAGRRAVFPAIEVSGSGQLEKQHRPREPLASDRFAS